MRQYKECQHKYTESPRKADKRGKKNIKRNSGLKLPKFD